MAATVDGLSINDKSIKSLQRLYCYLHDPLSYREKLGPMVSSSPCCDIAF